MSEDICDHSSLQPLQDELMKEKEKNLHLLSKVGFSKKIVKKSIHIWIMNSFRVLSTKYFIILLVLICALNLKSKVSIFAVKFILVNIIFSITANKNLQIKTKLNSQSQPILKVSLHNFYITILLIKIS